MRLSSDRMTIAHEPALPPAEDEALRSGARRFFRTPFKTRRNVVKVWRPVPGGLWTALDQPSDAARSIRRELRAIAAVLFMIAVIIAASGLRWTAPIDREIRTWPAFGSRSAHAAADARQDHPAAETGWTFAPGQTFAPVLWTVVPSVLGWWLVRGVWIPLATRRRDDRSAAITAARLLSAAYAYIYLMIAAGALLNVLLVRIAPAATDRFRWWLWLFLFGESFFVPAVMWIRLVRADKPGQAFGSARHAWLVVYLTVCVVIPLGAMSWRVFGSA